MGNVVCIFGDWKFSWTATPWFAYRAGGSVPLKWLPAWARPNEISLSDLAGTDIEWMALAGHWAQEHRQVLEALLGEPVEIDGFPRARPSAD
jgi:hypothetical protein